MTDAGAGRRCAGRPAICDRCAVDLQIDPAGPWCRICRRAWPGSGRYPSCPMPAVATGATARTTGLRLCRLHARRLVDGAGPDAVIADPKPQPE
ncbi:hypothetical protein [Catenulispora rubra]|uniref:hypothetical protein n=1 Tax=Catenulispora rubra TaxID=280293 RepID=UPI00189264CD|nr:hypothetical protein [Catenulispora rubra]